MSAGCSAAPRAQLLVDADNGWPHIAPNASQYR